MVGCAAGIMVAEVADAPAAAADGGAFPPNSGLLTGTPKPLPYAELPGFLSKEQLSPHHTAHYGGALRTLAADEKQLDELLQGGKPLTGAAHSYLQRDKVNRANSVVLHELYFENMAAQAPPPQEDVRAAIARRFGTFERWIEDFQATAIAAQGWGILARDAVNGKLYNVASDLHEVGVLWFGQPLLVCDVYEHAYYVDYQNRKNDYVRRFVEHIHWNEVNRRYQASL